MTSAELETHLARIWNLSLSDMSRGATAGVLEDARRDLIQSPELLESLAVWQQSVVRLGRWDEYLVRAGERLSHYTYARWPNRGYGFFPHETRSPRNPEVLLSSVEFESLVYERGVAAVGLMEQRTRIERLLIEELAGGPAGAR
jgi:hypothetical protein